MSWYWKKSDSGIDCSGDLEGDIDSHAYQFIRKKLFLSEGAYSDLCVINKWVWSIAYGLHHIIKIFTNWNLYLEDL